LAEFTRVPVCARCMASVTPMAAEYFCVSCRTPFQNGFPLDEEGRCRLCRAGARGFDIAYCFGGYDGTLRELIHLFKYGRMKPLAVPLAAHLASALPRDHRFDVVVPMPLHWRREWQRGFNQSELLARAMARRCGISMVNAVRRTRSTATQAGLSNAKRRENVAGVFRVKKAHAIVGRRVVLIDDVMTTGATAGACALALKRAGAKSVALLALARVDRRLFDPANEVSAAFATAFSTTTEVS
jgi:ComF family protein